jgi:hypothetical protein
MANRTLNLDDRLYDYLLAESTVKTGRASDHQHDSDCGWIDIGGETIVGQLERLVRVVTISHCLTSELDRKFPKY